jgi:GH18 family chitinase
MVQLTWNIGSFILTTIILQSKLWYVSSCGQELKRVCYYTTWGRALPEPAHLCTHVIYSFASIQGGTLGNVWSNPLKSLKQTNPNVKIMLAVGGWK